MSPTRPEVPLPSWLRESAIARVADRLARPDGRLNRTPQSSFEGWPASRALSVLAIAEVEPALLLEHGARLAELVDVLASRWASPQTPSQEEARSLDVGAGVRSTDAAPAGSLPARARARTAFGGLLFLLNLAGELGWPTRWLDDPVLAARGSRWGLYQLALRLLPLAGQHDPAALAFAGLLPGADPPDVQAPPPDAIEETALAAVRGELLAALRARLPQAPDDNAALLMQVSKREGEILADPGWLELHLSFDEVRTEVRVAGLDLDPGWVPWLGLVIRFVYG